MHNQNNHYRNQNITSDYTRYPSSQYSNQFTQGNQYRPTNQYGQTQTNVNDQYTTQSTSIPYSQQLVHQQDVGQQSKMIKNPELNVANGPEMNDKDFLNDILALEKYMSDGFNVFVREASHRELFNDVKAIQNDIYDCARDLFDLSFKDGFYGFQGATEQEIQKARQKFSNYIEQQDPFGNSNMSF